MNATAHTTLESSPIWVEHSATCFTVRTSPNHGYGVHVDGAGFLVVIPGQPMRKCTTRSEVERVCTDAMLTHMACDYDFDFEEDDAAGIPSPDSLRRWHEGRVL